MAKNNYQLGSDEDWLKVSNEELAALVKKRSRQLMAWRFLCLLLLLLLGWTAYKFSAIAPIEQLWSN